VAFANLMENGCKFSSDHQCIVSVLFNEENIKLKFTDKGIGISEDDIQNIFTPFYRGENKKFSEGTGIGLYLTQRIIQLHKGSIRVQSLRGKGTTFTIELPHI
jgi:signal transduction histidine kinase